MKTVNARGPKDPKAVAATLRLTRVDTYHRQRVVDLDETEGRVWGLTRPSNARLGENHEPGDGRGRRIACMGVSV